MGAGPGVCGGGEGGAGRAMSAWSLWVGRSWAFVLVGSCVLVVTVRAADCPLPGSWMGCTEVVLFRLLYNTWHRPTRLCLTLPGLSPSPCLETYTQFPLISNFCSIFKRKRVPLLKYLFSEFLPWCSGLRIWLQRLRSLQGVGSIPGLVQWVKGFGPARNFHMPWCSHKKNIFYKIFITYTDSPPQTLFCHLLFELSHVSVAGSTCRESDCWGWGCGKEVIWAEKQSKQTHNREKLLVNEFGIFNEVYRIVFLQIRGKKKKPTIVLTAKKVQLV